MTDEDVIRAAFRNRGEAVRGGAYLFAVIAGLVLACIPFFAFKTEIVATAAAFAALALGMFILSRRLDRRPSPILETLLRDPTRIVDISATSGEMGTLLTISAADAFERINVMGQDQPLLDALRRRSTKATFADMRDRE